MGRKARNTKELKLEIVKRFLNDLLYLANEYDIIGTNGKTLIWKWANRYK